MNYNFLLLSVLFLIPGAVIFLLRRDLRRVELTIALLSLPFAFTEFLFYPEYWQPDSLFNLIARIGFGIEDFLFVVGLGALSSSLFPFAARKGITETPAVRRKSWPARLALLFVPTASAVVVFAFLRFPMIYVAPVIMTVAAAFIVFRRHDLLLPSLFGGALTLLVYGAVSLLFLAIIPGVFELDWNTDQFLNRYVLGIPVEELMYGFSAGLIGSVFYPYVFGAGFTCTIQFP